MQRVYSWLISPILVIQKTDVNTYYCMAQVNQFIIKPMDASRKLKIQNKASKNKEGKAAKAVNEVVPQISGDSTTIQSLIATLGEQTTARFKAAKKLQLISQDNPSLLYPYFEVFVKLLENDSSVMLWNGAIILSYLVKVDKENHFDDVFGSYYSHLWDGKLVTAANILVSSGRIARCRPDLACRITVELLKVDEIPLPTTECREVARGHVLASLAEYPDMLKNNQLVNDFIVRCTASHRPAVKKRAKELLIKINQY
jgi:hypothetical protein